jgi:hypothetical protein
MELPQEAVGSGTWASTEVYARRSDRPGSPLGSPRRGLSLAHHIVIPSLAVFLPTLVINWRSGKVMGFSEL